MYGVMVNGVTLNGDDDDYLDDLFVIAIVTMTTVTKMSKIMKMRRRKI